MKRFTHSVLSLAVLPLLGLSTGAEAGDAPALSTDATTVSISATVLDNTCEVDASTPWILGNIKVSDIMNNTGAAVKPVQISLQNCGTGVSGITVAAADASVDDQGMIKNQITSTSSVAASNVQAQILAGENSTAPGTPLTSKPVKFTEKGDSPLKFNVKLLSAGSKPTAGEFSANVALKLAYE